MLTHQDGLNQKSLELLHQQDMDIQLFLQVQES